MSDRYFEDFKLGERFVSGGMTMTESERWGSAWVDSFLVRRGAAPNDVDRARVHELLASGPLDEPKYEFVHWNFSSPPGSDVWHSKR